MSVSRFNWWPLVACVCAALFITTLFFGNRSGADTVDRVHGGTAQAWYRVAMKQTHNAERLSGLNHKLLKLNARLLDER